MALNFPNSGLYEGYQYTGDNGVTYTVKIGSITQTMSATPEADTRVIIYGADPFNLQAQNGQIVAVEITVG